MFSYYLNFRTYSDSCTSALYDTLVVSINYSVPFRRKAENFSYGQLERRDFLIVWGNSSMGIWLGWRERARGRTQPRSRLVYERARHVSTREPRTRRLEDAESSPPSKHCAPPARRGGSSWADCWRARFCARSAGIVKLLLRRLPAIRARVSSR
jgi:hypothetical protein